MADATWDWTARDERSGRDALLRSAGAISAALIAPAALAMSSEHLAAQAAGDGDVTIFLAWFSGVGLLAAVGVFIFARLARRSIHRQPPGAELSVLACAQVSLAIVLGALALSIAIAAPLAAAIGLFDTSAETGPLEWIQFSVWLASAAVALIAAARLKDRDSRGLMMLLAAGALLVAARECDLHEKLNSDRLGYWGVHYRRDWWLNARTPVLPRIAWAAAGLLIALVGGYLAWRNAIAIFIRRSPHGRLVWTLAASAGLMVAGYVLDDLLRYHEGINLRQSQVCEETVETAAAFTYAAAIAWGIKLGTRRR